MNKCEFPECTETTNLNVMWTPYMGFKRLTVRCPKHREGCTEIPNSKVPE